MPKQILKVTKDTYFKRRPVYLGHTPPNELHKVTAGSEFEIQSYAYADSYGDFDEHIKFALKTGAIDGYNTWFVFNRYAEVQMDGEVVYPLEEQTAAQILRITQDTQLKRRPIAAAELTSEELFAVTKGKTFELHSYAYADTTGKFDGHVRFAINKSDDFLRGLSTWYVYEHHGQVELDGAIVYPLDGGVAPTPTPAPAPAPKPTPPTYSGNKIQLPGGKGTVYTDQPIIPNGSFSWGEATHGGVRVPQNAQHANNIIALATQLEKARQQIGKPFRITSWYRPEPWNSRAGGARMSQHLAGKGVDIVVTGYMGRDLGNKFISWWPGGLGIYPGNRKHILHLDVGPKRKWGF